MRLMGQFHQRVGPAPAAVLPIGPAIGDSFADALASSNIEEGGILQFPKQGDSLLVFVSPGCTACEALPKALAAFQSNYVQDLDILLISTSGNKERNDEFLGLLGRVMLPFLPLPKLAESIGITGTPYSLWLDPGGTIVAKGLTSNLEHLQSLQNARMLGVSSINDYHRKVNLEPVEVTGNENQ
jgi:hypothetical protein